MYNLHQETDLTRLNLKLRRDLNQEHDNERRKESSAESKTTLAWMLMLE